VSHNQTVKGIDCTDNLLGHAHALQNAGVGFVIKYVTPSHTFPNKTFTTGEVQGLHSVGIKIGLVSEMDGTSAAGFSSLKGTSAAQNMLARIESLGCPRSMVGWVAIDYDATDEDIDGPITAHFEAYRAVMGSHLRHGVYGSGSVCQKLKERGFVSFTWLAQSPGFDGYYSWINHADVVQHLNPPPLGLSADWNSANDSTLFW